MPMIAQHWIFHRNVAEKKCLVGFVLYVNKLICLVMCLPVLVLQF